MPLSHAFTHCLNLHFLIQHHLEYSAIRSTPEAMASRCSLLSGTYSSPRKKFARASPRPWHPGFVCRERNAYSSNGPCRQERPTAQQKAGGSCPRLPAPLLRRQVRWLSSIPLVRLPLSNQGTQAYQIVWNNVHLHQVRTLGLASVVTLVHRFLFEKKRPRTLLEQT